MHNAADTAIRAETVHRPAACVSARLLGIALMSLLPAIFWTAVVAIAAPVFSFEISAGSLLRMAAGIALFLAVVTAAVTQRST